MRNNAGVSSSAESLRFLLIRRDNIGDLVCTTPLFRALRERFPQARIEALVNSYNAPVLENNPDLDAVYAYTKAKHRPAGKSVLGVYWDRMQLQLHLRRSRFDYVILAAPGFQPRSLQFARLLKPRHIVGFVEPGNSSPKIDIALPYALPRSMHETENVFRLLEPLGIAGTPPAQRVVAKRISNGSPALYIEGGVKPLVIGVHISARKPSQRWPMENFAKLMERLGETYNASFLLFWSPGNEANPLHPGDDEKARRLLLLTHAKSVTPSPTDHLSQLIAGLDQCDIVICSDGGAMHVTAGLGKPILCFFGKSDATRWYPWGVPHVVLQPPGMDVIDIGVEQAFAAFEQLLKVCQSQSMTAQINPPSKKSG
ncbi:MAG: glycosyltransferase family 9 protein [Pseudomonadota bacterium]